MDRHTFKEVTNNVTGKGYRKQDKNDKETVTKENGRMSLLRIDRDDHTGLAGGGKKVGDKGKEKEKGGKTAEENNVSFCRSGNYYKSF